MLCASLRLVSESLLHHQADIGNEATKLIRQTLVSKCMNQSPLSIELIGQFRDLLNHSYFRVQISARIQLHRKRKILSTGLDTIYIVSKICSPNAMEQSNSKNTAIIYIYIYIYVYQPQARSEMYFICSTCLNDEINNI